MRKITINTLFGLIAAVLLIPASWASDVNITTTLPHVDINYQGKKVRIERNQDQEHKLTNSFSKTSRKCPPFCIQPTQAAPGVATASEIDVLDFLMSKVKRGDGMLIDARVESFYKKGTIPGSVNIPFTVFTKDLSDPSLNAALKKLGGKKKAMGDWDFSNAKSLMLWCNGPWCGQSPRAINGLISLGYPPSLLFYYRGGMQMWQILGMTTVPGK